MKKLSLKTVAARLKTDRKARNTVICAGVGVLIVIAAAVTVPIALHNRAPVAQAAEPSVTVTEPTTAENTTAAPTNETVVETTAAVSEATEPTSTASPMGNSVSVTEKKESSKSAAKPAAQSTGNGSGAAAKQPQENTPPAQQETPAAPAQSDEHVWTQTEVDAIVAEIKAYAQSKGFRINSSMTTQGTSWNNPANTSWYAWAGENAIPMVKSKLKDEVDFVFNMGINRFGYIPEESFLNIVVVPCSGIYGEAAWEIYVVY